MLEPEYIIDLDPIDAEIDIGSVAACLGLTSNETQ